jgi:hypothetical protein
MQHYAQEYHYLLPQYKRLEEPRAFRVVFAIRPPIVAAAAAAVSAAAGIKVPGRDSANVNTGEGYELSDEQLKVSYRQVLNPKELLQWCNAWKPTAAVAADLQGLDSTAAAAGAWAQRYTHTVCVAHVFGQHGKVDVAPRAAGSSGRRSSLRRKLQELTSKVRHLLGGGPSDQTAAGSAQPCAGCDPELDPRALMTDLAVLDHAGE